MKPASRVISVDGGTHEEFVRLANRRGMKVKMIPALLLEAWKLLTPEQVVEASRQFEERFAEPSRRRVAKCA